MRFSRGQDWPGKATDSGAIVVTESRPQVGILFGFLVLALAVALARGVTGAQTTSGRVAAAVFGSILVVAFIASWMLMTRRPARMEVTDTVIVLGFFSRNAGVSRYPHGDHQASGRGRLASFAQLP